MEIWHHITDRLRPTVLSVDMDHRHEDRRRAGLHPLHFRKQLRLRLRRQRLSGLVHLVYTDDSKRVTLQVNYRHLVPPNAQASLQQQKRNVSGFQYFPQQLC